MTKLLCAVAFVAFALDSAAAADKLQISDLAKISEWRALNPAAMLIKGEGDRWYRAELDSACMKLDTGKGVSFITEPGPAGPYSAVVVNHHQCRITSLKPATPSDLAAKTSLRP